jgi:DNA-binding NarL/FixJ family response regulator
MLDKLTAREREVALLVARGLANKEIARELELSQGTVKLHVHSIFLKLGVRTRCALILMMSRSLATVNAHRLGR